MQEPAVVLTDLLISVIGLICAWKLWSTRAERQTLNHYFVGLFLATAVSAFFGALGHGIMVESGEQARAAATAMVFVCIGASSYNLWRINTYLLFSERIHKAFHYVIIACILLYLVIVLFVDRSFKWAIICYSPPSIVLTLIVIARVARDRSRYNIYGLLGLLSTFVATYVQQAPISIHPIYFNHNALYHVILAFGLWGVYLFGSRISRWNM